MECKACNYKYEWSVDTMDYTGDEEFIKLNITVTIEKDYNTEKRVYLYACPKCNIVQMNKW